MLADGAELEGDATRGGFRSLNSRSQTLNTQPTRINVAKGTAMIMKARKERIRRCEARLVNGYSKAKKMVGWERDV
jgi:hypothetical protein